MEADADLSSKTDITLWFKFFPKDFILNDAVQLMTLEERGAYIMLLANAWVREAGLPANPDLLWRLAGANSREHFESIAPRVLSQFNPDPNDPDRLINKRLIREWEHAQEYSQAQKIRGKIGAEKRWHGAAIATPIANDGQTAQHSTAQKEEETYSPAAPASGELFADDRREFEVHGNYITTGIVSVAGKKFARAQLREQVKELFEFYLTTVKLEGLRAYSEKRAKKGYARLLDALEITAGDLNEALELMRTVICKLARDPFYNGNNEQKKKYLEWDENLFKSTEQFERWITR